MNRGTILPVASVLALVTTACGSSTADDPQPVDTAPTISSAETETGDSAADASSGAPGTTTTGAATSAAESGEPPTCANGNDAPECEPGRTDWIVDLLAEADIVKGESFDAVGVGISARGPVAVVEQSGFRTVLLTVTADGQDTSTVEWVKMSAQVRSMAVARDGRVALGGYMFGNDDPGFVAVVDAGGEAEMFDDQGGYGSVRQLYLEGPSLVAAANLGGQLTFVGYDGGEEAWRHTVDGLETEAGINHPVAWGSNLLWGASERTSLGVASHGLLIDPGGSAPEVVFSDSSRSSFVGVAKLADHFAIATANSPDSSTTDPIVWIADLQQVDLPKFGVAHVFPTAIAVDPRGNLVIGLASQISSLGAVVKLDPAGELLWSRSLLDDADDPSIIHDVHDVAVDDGGYVYALTKRAELFRLVP